jgi:hypothetical protein
MSVLERRAAAVARFGVGCPSRSCGLRAHGPKAAVRETETPVRPQRDGARLTPWHHERPRRVCYGVGQCPCRVFDMVDSEVLSLSTRCAPSHGCYQAAHSTTSFSTSHIASSPQRSFTSATRMVEGRVGREGARRFAFGSLGAPAALPRCERHGGDIVGCGTSTRAGGRGHAVAR